MLEPPCHNQDIPSKAAKYVDVAGYETEKYLWMLQSGQVYPEGVPDRPLCPKLKSLASLLILEQLTTERNGWTGLNKLLKGNRYLLGRVFFAWFPCPQATRTFGAVPDSSSRGYKVTKVTKAIGVVCEDIPTFGGYKPSPSPARSHVLGCRTERSW